MAKTFGQKHVKKQEKTKKIKAPTHRTDPFSAGSKSHQIRRWLKSPWETRNTNQYRYMNGAPNQSVHKEGPAVSDTTSFNG